jgi:hypothetical protein
MVGGNSLLRRRERRREEQCKRKEARTHGHVKSVVDEIGCRPLPDRIEEG